MADQPQYEPVNTTAPKEPVYGEMQQTEELEEAAPRPGPDEELPPGPALPPPESGPSRRNIIDVLPPDNTAPSATGMTPRPPAIETANVILGYPGMDPSVRGLAMMVLRGKNMGRGALGQPGYAEGPIPSSPPEGEYDTTEMGEV